MNPLAEKIEKSFERYPDNDAIVIGEVTLSYNLLKKKCDFLLKEFDRLGVGEDEPIGFMLDNSIQTVVLMLSCVLSNRTYIPIYKETPIKQLKSIIKKTSLRWLIIDKGWDLDLDKDEVNISELGEDLTLNCKLKKLYVTSEQPSMAFDEVQYIMSTSGSTGEPKCIPVSYKNVISFLAWITGEIKVSPDDRLAGHTPNYFDLSVFDLFSALTSGASYYVMKQEDRQFPVSFIANNKISMILIVPFVLELMIKTRQVLMHKELSSLKALLVCGDVLHKKSVVTWLKNHESIPIYNLYGPTEATVAISLFKIDKLKQVEKLKSIPIGSVNNCNLKVEGNDCQADGVKKLFLVGDQIVNGYLGDDTETKRLFTTENNNTKYDSGDLVVVDEQGLIYFVGRRDYQIKKDGYRIELSEIDCQVTLIDEVISSISIFYNNLIYTFVVLRKSISKEELFTLCKSLVAEYKIPDEFIVIDNLPLNKNGKVDRSKLKELIVQGNVPAE